LWTLQSSRAVEFAAEEVRANHTETIDQAVNILSNDGSDSSVAVLAEAVARADENEGYRFAEALSTIASPAAYDALLDLRESGRKKSHVYAMWGFSHLWSRSPAAEPAEGAQRILEITSPGSSVPASESDPLRGAFELLDAAQSMDPLLPQIYSHRGSAWQRKENWEEAAREYRAALTLNPDDHVALTGFAITMVMQSRESEAFEWVKAAAPFFKDNNIYLYNSACVYGRALERAQAAAPSPERDAHIEEYRKQALGFLSQSLERGFEQPELMKADPDLKALRGDPQFEKLSGRASGTDPAP
jgi:tetratricopeptide (TPR) repeat protein